MRRFVVKSLIFAVFAAPNLACQRILSDSTNSAANATANSVDAEKTNASPFATKEPEKYQATIVFASQAAAGAANYLEQTYFTARDGANRRLDFEIGSNKIVHLQLADNRQFVILPDKKVYAELRGADEKLFANQPNEFSLEHLLHTKPAGATFQRIGTEELGGRRTTKYRLNFGAVNEAAEARTETTVWADDELKLPLKTEVVAIENNNPSGAKSTMELRRIRLETEPNLFEVPKDFRQISYQEAGQILKR